MSKARGPNHNYEELVAKLFDVLADSPEGLTMDQIIEALDVNDRFVASKVITELRLDLGEGDSIVVPAVQEGKRHIYKLEANFNNSRQWLAKRARYKAKMIRTDVASLNALVRGSDGRTNLGKTIRRLDMSMDRLDEDVTMYLDETMSFLDAQDAQEAQEAQEQES